MADRQAWEERRESTSVLHIRVPTAQMGAGIQLDPSCVLQHASPVRANAMRWNRVRFHLIAFRSSCDNRTTPTSRRRAFGKNAPQGRDPRYTRTR